MTKCPACASSTTPGYVETPVSPAHPYGKVTRCACCQGTGVASPVQIMGWELSL